jgi:hypothetical protein
MQPLQHRNRAGAPPPFAPPAGADRIRLLGSARAAWDCMLAAIAGAVAVLERLHGPSSRVCEGGASA